MPILKGVAGAIAAVGLAAAVTIILGRTPDGRSEPASAAGGAAAVGAALPGTAVLFHVAEDGTALVERTVEVPAEDDALTKARLIAELQLSPPDPPLISPFPEGTRLRAIYLSPDGNAFVDLSEDVSAAHPGGSLDELFTIYAMVNALTANVDEIAAVQVLIEGREVDTLAGHVDLRRPLELALRWVAGAADPAPGRDEAPAED